MSITTHDALDRADMERLATGQDAALNDLMERHATPVFHFLCRRVGNEDDANDLAQETFVRVFRARASFRSGEKFSTWLYTIAANLARNHFRWQSRHPDVLAGNRNRRRRTNPRRHLAGERAGAERTGTGRRARCGGAGCGRQIAGRFARGDCAVRMGGTQRDRGGSDSRIHPQSRGIAIIPRPADFAGTVEAVVVKC